MKNCIKILLLLLFFLSSCGHKNSDSVLIIEPYKINDRWYFDDPKTKLYREPFAGNIGLMFEDVASGIPDATNGFRLYFSSKEFPDYTMKLKWTRSKNKGNFYYSKKLNIEGWLCPALLKYYKTPPAYLYGKAEPKNKL